MNSKIKFLFLGASPINDDRLRLDEEAREIERGLDGAPHRDAFEFVTQLAIRLDDLQLALLNHAPHIVHFSGHGTEKEGIVIEDKLGNSQPIGPKTLAAIFKRLNDNIHLVVLNACFSRAQAHAISKVVDHTIGMSSAITDDAAVAFSTSFYRMLSFGRSVKDSFELAKAALMLPSLSEDKKPRLLVKEGVDSTRPFLAQLIPAPPPAEKEKHQPGHSSGSRGVSIGGSVTGSVIGTGDHMTVGKLPSE
ncbi:MAG: CHAT domain-containing protein [Blastocatellia bacterium]